MRKKACGSNSECTALLKEKAMHKRVRRCLLLALFLGTAPVALPISVLAGRAGNAC
jgi:hypothetical protein